MALTKADYIRNSIFASARLQFSLLLQEGCSIQDVAVLAQEIQGSVHRALHAAINEAGHAITGTPGPTPPWGFGPNPNGGSTEMGDNDKKDKDQDEDFNPFA